MKINQIQPDLNYTCLNTCRPCPRIAQHSFWSHYTKHEYILRSDSPHKGILSDTQHNKAPSLCWPLCVVMLRVIMLSVVILSVVAPLCFVNIVSNFSQKILGQMFVLFSRCCWHFWTISSPYPKGYLHCSSLMRFLVKMTTTVVKSCTYLGPLGLIRSFLCVAGLPK
jgi:hypothetical protein